MSPPLPKKRDRFVEPHCSAHYPTIAALDLGTNSCRLLIARVNLASIGASFYRLRPRQYFWRIIDSYAKVIRLGEGLHATMRLTPEAIDRAIEALEACRKKIDKYQPDSIRLVATEACRRAENSYELVQRAKDELNLTIEIISSDHEAELAIKGCASSLDPHIPYGIVFDIGGGSTEVIFVTQDKSKIKDSYLPNNFRVIDSISLPYGVVTTSEEFSEGFSDDEIELFEKSAYPILMPFIKRNNIYQLIKQKKVQVLGSSGTITTLAAFFLKLPFYDRKLIDGLEMRQNDLLETIETILSLSEEEKSKNPCIGNARSDFVITGSVILRFLCKHMRIPTLKVADRGVREGILLDLVGDLIDIN